MAAAAAATESSAHCFFERLGDTLHHVLPFLKTPWLLRLDAALTNRQDRALCWLPKVRVLDNAKEVLGSANKKKWLLALRWLVARDVAMPERFIFKHSIIADALACLAQSSSASNIREIIIGVAYELEGAREIIIGANFSASDLKGLECCSQLTHLTLCVGAQYNPSLDFVWKYLQKENWKCYATLRSLRIDYARTSADGLRVICQAQTLLTELTARYTDDQSLEALCGMQHLEVVHLHNYYNAGSAQGFSNLSRLGKLRKFTISGCHIQDAVLEHIRSIPVRELHCDECSGLSDAGNAHLASLTGLTTLELHGCSEATDALLEAVSGLAGLQVFAISFSSSQRNRDVTDVGVSYLRKLTALRKLVLCNFPNLTAQSIVHVGCFPHLESLSFEQCEIFHHPESLDSLQHLKLRELDLSFTDVTNAGLDKLHAFRNLKELRLYACWEMGEKGVGRLLDACPQITRINVEDCDSISRKFKKALGQRRWVGDR